MNPTPQPGQLFMHFKGGYYVVLAVGTYSESGERQVCYRSVSDGSIWMRPLTMWNQVMKDGISRFTRVGV